MTYRNKLAAATVAAIALTFAGASAAQQGAKPAAGQPRVATADEAFAQWDKDKNKTLSLEEFKAGFQTLQAQSAVRKLHQNFTAMDKNKSGTLEQDEFASLEVVKQAGAKAPAFATFDADKNGKLDFKEYLSLIEKMVRAK